MKVLIITLFLAAFITITTKSQEHHCDYHLRQSIRLNQLNEYRSSDFAENYDLKYHRIKWDLDPKKYYIKGSVYSLFQVVPDSINYLEFELSSSLSVDSVMYHGFKTALLHKSQGILRITLPQFIYKNQLDSLEIYYHGAPESNGSGSFVKDVHNSNVPVIWTLSQPYGSRDWWPCKHSLNDKIDSLDIFVKTSKGNLVASNGIIASEFTDSLYYYCHWKHRYPIPAYLVAVAVTNYDRFSDWVYYDNRSLEILNYIYPESVAAFRSNIAHTVDIMHYFLELFGFYPFDKEKYGHAQFGRNGGMEHQTMSFMGHFSEMLVSHELAHQWFGDYITCQSWQDIWLNESFATFCDGITTERFQSKKTYLDLLKNRNNAVTSQPGGSVYIPAGDTNNVSRVFSYRLSYQKGALVLNMLRFMMGDTLFFQAIRNYLNDSTLMYSYSKTDDFKRHVENVYKQDMTLFFDKWIYKQGYPSYTITYFKRKNHLKIIVSQIQSDASVDFFELPLPIYVKGQYGDSMLILNNTHNHQVFDIDLKFEPDTIFFDPEYKLISANNTIISKELEGDEGIIVFPNPCSYYIYIQFLKQYQITKLSIYDLKGNLVYYQNDINEVVNPGEIYKADFNDRRLKNGLYLMKMETSENVLVRRFEIYQDRE